jgi:hypothetical protein
MADDTVPTAAAFAALKQQVRERLEEYRESTLARV